MRTKKLPRIFIMLFCAFLFHMGSLTAYAAAESAEVRIPVSAVGADCTAALMDENGEVLQTITLIDGSVSAFVTECDGLGSHRFTIKLTDTDTVTTVYDRTEYSIDVQLFYSDDLTIFYTIEADPVCVIGGVGKPEKLEFVNVYTPLPCEVDPPVQKKVNGKPPVAGTFTFVMEALSAEYPMPEGSDASSKTVSITGPGSVEFGVITFTEEGVYEYTITERNNRALWYTYDTAVYTLRFTVTDVDGQLESTCTVFKNGTEEKDATSAVFTNTYSIIKTPKTGEDSDAGLWLTISLISLCALAVTIFLRRRQCKTAEDADWEANGEEYMD